MQSRRRAVRRRGGVARADCLAVRSFPAAAAVLHRRRGRARHHPPPLRAHRSHALHARRLRADRA
eukprot:31487-Pelagococcus_subviridis.AAC.15